MAQDEIRVWYRIPKDDRRITLKDVFEKLEELQKANPADDLFFDGDEFAICSRPKAPSPEHEHERHDHHGGRKKARQTNLPSV
jgi:hypothetical protein